jgi:alanine-alpha-ketoisovalerate/valine-pyruvate aminotransferase
MNDMNNPSTLIATGEITNECTCVMCDENGDPTDEITSYCYGDCWQDSLDFFGMITQELRDSNETDWWRVQNIVLWNGAVSGYFYADEVAKMLEGMAVNGSWIIRYSVFTDHIEYSLSHHDAPMGSKSSLHTVSQQEYDAIGILGIGY